MAALILDDARAARKEAERIRLVSLELRLAIRASNRVARARTERAAAAAAAAAAARQHRMRSASPWSNLVWLRADDEVERALVPLD